MVALSSTLNNATILNPLAKPPATTNYILAAYDNKGCPKAGLDSVLVTVLPDILAYAGRDTAAVIGQPLQLKASGGVRYNWIPGEGLSATNIPDPVVTHFIPSTGIQL